MVLNVLSEQENVDNKLSKDTVMQKTSPKHTNLEIKSFTDIEENIDSNSIKEIKGQTQDSHSVRFSIASINRYTSDYNECEVPINITHSTIKERKQNMGMVKNISKENIKIPFDISLVNRSKDNFEINKHFQSPIEIQQSIDNNNISENIKTDKVIEPLREQNYADLLLFDDNDLESLDKIISNKYYISNEKLSPKEKCFLFLNTTNNKEYENLSSKAKTNHNLLDFSNDSTRSYKCEDQDINYFFDLPTVFDDEIILFDKNSETAEVSFSNITKNNVDKLEKINQKNNFELLKENRQNTGTENSIDKGPENSNLSVISSNLYSPKYLDCETENINKHKIIEHSKESCLYDERIDNDSIKKSINSTQQKNINFGQSITTEIMTNLSDIYNDNRKMKRTDTIDEIIIDSPKGGLSISISTLRHSPSQQNTEKNDFTDPSETINIRQNYKNDCNITSVKLNKNQNIVPSDHHLNVSYPESECDFHTTISFVEKNLSNLNSNTYNTPKKSQKSYSVSPLSTAICGNVINFSKYKSDDCKLQEHQKQYNERLESGFETIISSVSISSPNRSPIDELETTTNLLMDSKCQQSEELLNPIKSDISIVNKSSIKSNVDEIKPIIPSIKKPSQKYRRYSETIKSVVQRQTPTTEEGLYKTLKDWRPQHKISKSEITVNEVKKTKSSTKYNKIGYLDRSISSRSSNEPLTAYSQKLKEPCYLRLYNDAFSRKKALEIKRKMSNDQNTDISVLIPSVPYSTIHENRTMYLENNSSKKFSPISLQLAQTINESNFIDNKINSAIQGYYVCSEENLRKYSSFCRSKSAVINKVSSVNKHAKNKRNSTGNIVEYPTYTTGYVKEMYDQCRNGFPLLDMKQTSDKSFLPDKNIALSPFINKKIKNHEVFTEPLYEENKFSHSCPSCEKAELDQTANSQFHNKKYSSSDINKSLIAKGSNNCENFITFQTKIISKKNSTLKKSDNMGIKWNYEQHSNLHSDHEDNGNITIDQILPDVEETLDLRLSNQETKKAISGILQRSYYQRLNSVDPIEYKNHPMSQITAECISNSTKRSSINQKDLLLFKEKTIDDKILQYILRDSIDNEISFKEFTEYILLNNKNKVYSAREKAVQRSRLCSNKIPSLVMKFLFKEAANYMNLENIDSQLSLTEYYVNYNISVASKADSKAETFNAIGLTNQQIYQPDRYNQNMGKTTVEKDYIFCKSNKSDSSRSQNSSKEKNNMVLDTRNINLTPEYYIKNNDISNKKDFLQNYKTKASNNDYIFTNLIENLSDSKRSDRLAVQNNIPLLELSSPLIQQNGSCNYDNLTVRSEVINQVEPALEEILKKTKILCSSPYFETTVSDSKALEALKNTQNSLCEDISDVRDLVGAANTLIQFLRHDVFQSVELSNKVLANKPLDVQTNSILRSPRRNYNDYNASSDRNILINKSTNKTKETRHIKDISPKNLSTRSFNDKHTFDALRQYESHMWRSPKHSRVRNSNQSNSTVDSENNLTTKSPRSVRISEISDISFTSDNEPCITTNHVLSDLMKKSDNCIGEKKHKINLSSTNVPYMVLKVKDCYIQTD